ncbi:BTAD domain-containing putative transcriptional regulator [Nonomuraea typhae]|uniref:BTAD domain-containing putative transcriptional regulator n=1 Tax=Nonomuraea typhae TaxID=2603600 RepID=UPI0012FA8D52|nr:BTAD domain-containing putative transcriptional regulator [Nonomuraea typhae]
MRFGVLGPLTVRAEDGREVDIPEAKVRTVLAVLLAGHGRVVPADLLIDVLWGERLPEHPVAALRAKVSRLRKALGDPALVAWRAPGYLLACGDVDASRFESLLARARAAQDPAEKTTLLGDALALWRGAAFAEYADAEFARAAALRLEEQRLAAIEEQAQARLALGAQGLSAELADVVARHPLRERLRAVHLRALYRDGRQGEALNGYHEIRTRLAEDLGVDPGPELRALHQSILRRDPALDLRRTNLPAPLTELVGREKAVEEIGELLAAARMVTLTGPGGVGKTRLALEAGARPAPAYDDGVWLADLAALDRDSDMDRVAEAVAAAMGVRHDVVDRLAAAIRSKHLLLLLDNCEHVVDAVAELAERLLTSAPGLRVLATSRIPLDIPGEHVHAVPPLDQDSAVRLFAARAAAAAPGFTPDEPAMEAIAKRLDGLPYALELAATRARTLSARELAARLDDRFHLLDTGRRAAPPRQQTLRAMIDWSWEPLTGSERAVLRRLAVHADGCTLEAAETVCAGDGVRTSEVAGLLARLVDRSLVTVSGDRYRLLESVQAYCLERLEEAAEPEAVRERHGAYYTALAVRARPHLHGPDQGRWLRRLDAEAANLRSALDDAVRRRAADRALRLVTALSWYWFLRGRLGEARRSLELALTLGGDPEARAVAAAWHAGVSLLIRDQPAAASPEHLDELCARIADPRARAEAQWLLSLAHSGFDDPSVSLGLASRALTAFRALDDTWGIAAALSVHASHTAVHDLDAARRDAEQSLALFGEEGDRWGLLQATHLLGSLAQVSGDYERARALHRDALDLAEDLRLWPQVADSLAMLGRIALLTGSYAEADDYHERARRLAADQLNTRTEQFAEVGLGLAARRRGDLDTAERHLRAWLDWCRQWRGDPGTALILAELGFVAELRGDPGTAFDLHREGLDAALTTGDQRAVALALEGLAGACAGAGDHLRAARLLGAGSAARDSVKAPLQPGERGDVDRITAAAQRAMGTDTFAHEFARGRLQGADTPIAASRRHHQASSGCDPG